MNINNNGNGTMNNTNIETLNIEGITVTNDNRNQGIINNGKARDISINDYKGANITINNNTRPKSNLGEKVKDTINKMTQKNVQHKYYSLVSKQGKALLLEFSGTVERQAGNNITASLQLLNRLMKQNMMTKDKLTIVLWKNLYNLINEDINSLSSSYDKQLAKEILEMKKRMKDRVVFKTSDVCKGSTEYIVKDLAWKNI